MTKRPSFLYFITDQQRADWLGCYGHPVLRTPHIDAIASRATRFTNFHVASPVCMPNRASLMTGRYPSVHGLRSNGCLLPQRAVTFVDQLAEAGYHTAAVGKSHLQPFSEYPPLRAQYVDDSFAGEAWRPEPGAYLAERPDRYRTSSEIAFPLPYYGFREIDMVIDHGDKCGGHYHQWIRANLPDWEALYRPEAELPHGYSVPQAFRTPIPEPFYPTAYIRDRAIGVLERQAGGDAPFFLFVSFPDPHHPFNPPGRYWDMYDPDAFDLPLPYEAHHNPTPPMRAMKELSESGQPPDSPYVPFIAQDQQVKEAMALTAGMMTMIDDAVGQVMDAVDRLGLREDTVVCYNSDHGDYLGDFGMLLKAPMPFRSVTRVPFLWADPDRPGGGTANGLASTVDIGPTILERAGLKTLHGTQGRSLMACLDGGDTGREALLIEYNGNGVPAGFTTQPRMRSVLTSDHRLTLYGGEPWGELYDLAQDPNETRNLWDSPAHERVKGDLSMQLNHLLTAQMDESPVARNLA